jgi:hypothetical protein
VHDRFNENLMTRIIPVLWIRIQIRKDPKLFAGSVSVSRGYGSVFGYGLQKRLFPVQYGTDRIDGRDIRHG